jgi:hypothetical protein
MSREARARHAMQVEDALDRKIFYGAAALTVALIGFGYFDVAGVATIWWLLAILCAVATDRLYP